MRRLRVKAYRTPGGGRLQKLQERRWWGWKTIDTEYIPIHALISLECLGDTGGWKSKFTEHGTFGRDGIIHPKEVSNDG